MSASEPASALLVVNARSGGGKCVGLGETLRGALAEEGVEVEVTALGEPLDGDDPRPVLIGGGDGTVRALLDDLARTKRPAWHLAWGTANLFAKSVGTQTLEPAEIAAAVRAGRTVDIDFGRVAGHAFACCASTGPDADALTRKEEGDRNTLSYLLAFASSIVTPRLPELTIEADGEAFVAGQRGVVLIANSSRHVGGAEPVAGASMRDGRLDLAFIPAGSGGKLVHWLGELVLTGRLSEEFIPRARVTRATVRSGDEPLVLQADGELVLTPDNGAMAFEVEAAPGALRVLVPVAATAPE